MKVFCKQISIYRKKDTHDCSNNGLTARFDHLLLICPPWIECQNPVEVELDNPPPNLVILVNDPPVIPHLEPYASPDVTHVPWWIKGGAYADIGQILDRNWKPIGSDVNFIPVFDRQETQEEADYLSR